MNVYDHEIYFDNHTVIVDYYFNRVGASFPEGDFYEDRNFHFDIQNIWDETGKELTEEEFKKIEPNYETIIQDEIERH